MPEIIHAGTSLPAEVQERLHHGAHAARGTMAPETGRTLQRGWLAFCRWAEQRGVDTNPLPASPELVAEYVDHLAGQSDRKPAGIRQAAWAIGRMHRIARYPDPTANELARLALKRMSRALGTRQEQAAPVGSYEVRRILDTAGHRPADLRNVALLLMQRDLLARRSEMVALNVEDVHHDRDSSATVLIRRSKTDQTGEGAELYLSPAAAVALRRWLLAASITEGAIFRSVNKAGRPGERLVGDDMARIMKRLAQQAGLRPEMVARISGHSCRVGMAQDLVASGADLAGVMQAGRWKSPQMPARYTARLEAKRGAVARFHERQGA